MLYEITVPQYKKMLSNLSTILDKAEEHFKEKKVTDEILLNLRLAPDMFPLGKQIHLVCDTVKAMVNNIAGKKTTENTYTEVTLVDYKARIQDAIAALDSVSKQDFEGTEAKLITQPRWEGKQMTGYDFVLQHSMPNLYFHITTAYNILRHNGLPIGKRDYLGKAPYQA